MRADDLSDLVAAVAASQEAEKAMKADMLTGRFDSLPRYTPKDELLDIDILDGILDAMTFRASLDFVIDTYRLNHHNLPTTGNRQLTTDNFQNRHTLAKEGFFRPVPGIITSRFGWRPQFGRMHHGVDLSLAIGDTVRAAVTGTVEKVAYDYDGYGNYVVLIHPDGMETIYGHLQYALVSRGQTIEAGYPIGIGGNTGNSTGPHLHFEARLGGTAVDPTLIFDFYGQYRYWTNNSESDDAASRKDPKSIAGRRTYIVRQGDTPKSIAKRAGISTLRLCQLNMIKESDPLQIGRMLKIQ